MYVYKTLHAEHEFLCDNLEDACQFIRYVSELTFSANVMPTQFIPDEQHVYVIWFSDQPINLDNFLEKFISDE